MRDQKIDFYKGMLMWGVVWGHTITCLLLKGANDVGIHPLFRTYDMPFFMVLSGFFLAFSIKKYSFVQLVGNKVTTILIPTMLWGLVSSKFTTPFASFYFLWAVFFSSLIVIFFNKIISNKVLQIVIYSLVIIGLHFQPYPCYNLPYLFPYFVLGFYCFNQIKDRQRCSPIAFVIFITSLCFWDPSYNIWNAGHDILANGDRLLLPIILRTVLAICGIFVAKWVFEILFREATTHYPKCCKIICAFGQETLSLYILHAIVLSRIVSKLVTWIQNKMGYNIFADNHLLLGYVIAPILALILMYVLYKGITICKRYQSIKWVFGFKLKIPQCK